MDLTFGQVGEPATAVSSLSLRTFWLLLRLKLLWNECSSYVAFLLLVDAIELTNRWKCVYFLNLMDTCNWTCMDCDSVMMQQLVMIMMIQTVNKENTYVVIIRHYDS